jgi:hypothetical protein
MKQLRRHWALILLLTTFLGLAVYQSVVLPLGEADDETDHYQYLRFVADTGHPPLTETERNEAGFKGGLAPLYYWLTAWPVALVGPDALPDVRRVDARPQRHIPTDGLGINHVLHTLDEDWPWQGQPLAWHQVRFLSVLMGLVTIIATYILARLVFEPKLVALGAAGFVALLPRFVFSSAAINDDNLVFALIAMLLVIQVKLLRQEHKRSDLLMALFGALFGLALVTKYFTLILLPEILFSLLILVRADTFHPYQGRLRKLWPFLVTLFLTAGVWFIFITIRFNRIAELGWIPGLAASLGEPQVTEGLVGLLSGVSVRPPASTYSPGEWLGFLYQSFWFEFGWMQIFAPGWIYMLFSLVAALALAGMVIKHPDHSALITLSRLRHKNQIMVLLSLHVGLFIFVVVARYVLSATIDTGQGRHLFPALPVIALLISGGVYRLAQIITHYLPRWRPAFSFTYFTLITPFLVAAFISLWPVKINGDFGSRFVSAAYHTHPVTITVPAEGMDHQLELTTTDFSLIGFTVPDRVTAGDALPVTLFWSATQSAPQDFLISLCLVNQTDQPVSCRQGYPENGRYLPRAWEAGDFILDTIYLPLPVCYRLNDSPPYTLKLTVWQHQPDSPTPQPIGAPLLNVDFNQQEIIIRATDLHSDQDLTDEIWIDNIRLTAPATIFQRQALSYITYATAPTEQPPSLIQAEDTVWTSASEPVILNLPCDEYPQEGSVRISSFISDPTLPPGQYSGGSGAPPIQLIQRQRQLLPVTSTLTFSKTLAPLSITVKDRKILTDTLKDNNPATRIDLSPNTPLPVTVRWQGRQWMAEPIVIALKLIDQEFQVGGQWLSTLGNRYPNVLWVPSESIQEDYWLQPEPGAAPGLYRLEIGLLRQDKQLPGGYENLPLMEDSLVVADNIYPAVTRLLDPNHDTSPPFPVLYQVGDSIQLTGYAITDQADRPFAQNKALETDTLHLALYWQSISAINSNFTVFTQLIGPDGKVWAQWDNPPQAGRYPTSAWLSQDKVIDRYTLTLPPDAPNGNYQLLVGMYDPATGERLPVSEDGIPQPDNAIWLTPVLVTRN